MTRASKKAELVFLPLGGAGEIGMNCYAYGLGSADAREWMLVDLGVKFAGDADPGIDIIVPDLRFIEGEGKKALSGLVITHGHEDHIGAIAWLWPRLECPIYCTAFAAALITRKLAERGLDRDVPINIVRPGMRFHVGSFECEFVEMSHSIPEPMGLMIRTPHANVFHSGDWKIDDVPEVHAAFNAERLAKLGEEGVDILVCDSTNAMREGSSLKEADVAATLREIVAGAKNRVVVTTFASHIARLKGTIHAARAAGREIVVVGRAMRNAIEAARACGYMHEEGEFLMEEAFGLLPRDKALLLCTGSQGEPNAALARIARDDHPNIALDDGDLAIFSSKTIPGNEIAAAAVHNNLAHLGVEIITADDAMIHASGHPQQDELAELYRLLKPKCLIPMHGEPRHLAAHADFAIASGIPESIIVENGGIARLGPGSCRIIDETPVGELHLDGSLLLPADEGPVRFRRKLAGVGVIAMSVQLDGRKERGGEFQCVLDGIPREDANGRLFEDIVRIAGEKALSSVPKGMRRDDEAVAEAVRNSVRRAVDMAWGKKPICHVMVHRM